MITTTPSSAFDKILENFREEYQALQTHRANPRLVEDILVEAYGATMKIQELASISAPESQTLIIQPWDSAVLKAIETALRQHDLALQPVVDGARIRLSFPPLTEEKRHALVKILHGKLEEARIHLRQQRGEMLKAFKQREQRGEISEDDYFREEKELQKMVDACNEELQKICDAKERELMII